jgi:trans-aconitate methyltransferase
MTTNLSCPICNAQSFSLFLQAKDYTVSQETFNILKCDHCGFMLTSPVPKDLNPYYQSPQYISHSNQTSGITDALYKFARTITLRWKTNLINHYNTTTQKTLLDYGCGTGAFLHHAQKNGWEISGVEPAEKPRAIASITTSIAVAESLQQLQPKKFSVITLWHVLEHVEHLHGILDQLTARLQNNGTIFIAVPNHKSLDARTYKSQWAAYDTPRHLWHFSQSTMTSLLNQHGLTVHKTLPMKLDALYVSILSEKYKSQPATTGIASLVRGLVTGIKSNLSAVRNQEYSSLIYIARK